MLSLLKNVLSPMNAGANESESEQLDRLYRYWRIRIFYSLFIGYTLYYFTRRSLNPAIATIIHDFHFEKAQFGMVTTSLAVAYGFSKFLSGMLSDRVNPRFFMGGGLLITGVLNFCFGMSSSLMAFILLWSLNGFFQGFGAPPCARLMVHWYSRSERGRWWAWWNTSHNVGGALIGYLGGWLCEHVGWRFGLYVPGVMCMLGGVFLMWHLRDTPETMGLPSVDRWRQDPEGPQRKSSEDDSLSAKQILFQYVLSNPYIWMLAVSYFFVYIVRQAANDWSPLYLVEVRGYSTTTAGGGIVAFELGGFFGSLAAGYLSDHLFKGRRGPINVLFMMGAGLGVAGLTFNPIGLPIWEHSMLFSIGFFIFGPQMLVGMAAAELAGKRAAGTATGFAGLCAYAGSAAAGYPIGWVTDHWGWHGFFMALLVASVVATLLLFPLWGLKTSHYHEAEREPEAEAELA